MNDTVKEIYKRMVLANDYVKYKGGYSFDIEYRNMVSCLNTMNRSSVNKYADGKIIYLLNGQRHREDGPAVEWSYGYESWYLNGRRHREDGPAVIYADGWGEWYLNGKELTERQFNEQRNKTNLP